MFAGAAREAVFSKTEVVRRVNNEFIPVALKAGLTVAIPCLMFHNLFQGRIERVEGELSRMATELEDVVHS